MLKKETMMKRRFPLASTGCGGGIFGECSRIGFGKGPVYLSLAAVKSLHFH